MKRAILCTALIAGAFVVCALPQNAGAMFVTECFAVACVPGPASSNPAPDLIIQGIVLYPTISIGDTTQSPFQGTSFYNAITGGPEYTSLQGSPDYPATQAKFFINAPGLLPEGAPRNTGALGISLLWGSPDYYNTIQFYDSSNVQVGSTITAADLTYPHVGPIGGVPAMGQDFVSIWPGAYFAYVILSTATNAFEFTDLEGICAPPGAACAGAPRDTDVTTLPATLPLFATGLGALSLLGWRRKRKGAAIAA